jgi:hypothetical protein
VRLLEGRAIMKIMKRLLVILALVGFAGLTQIAQSQAVIPQVAQRPIITGPPPSVTSLAPGRSFTPGPSVTSLGSHGHGTLPQVGAARPYYHRDFDRDFGRFRGRKFGTYGGYGAYGTSTLVVPYAVPVYPAYPEADVASPDLSTATPEPYPPDYPYAGRYGQMTPGQLQSGMQPAPAQNYAPASRTTAPATPAPSESMQQQPPVDHARPQATTILVFKDGRKLEVTNYAIEGSTLFNLGAKGPRKIDLADLNLPATVSVNDDNGVPFQLP